MQRKVHNTFGFLVDIQFHTDAEIKGTANRF